MGKAGGQLQGNRGVEGRFLAQGNNLGQIFTGSPETGTGPFMKRKQYQHLESSGARRVKQKGPLVCAIMCKSGTNGLHKHFITPILRERALVCIKTLLQVNNLCHSNSFLIISTKGTIKKVCKDRYKKKKDIHKDSHCNFLTVKDSKRKWYMS